MDEDYLELLLRFLERTLQIQHKKELDNRYFILFRKKKIEHLIIGTCVSSYRFAAYRATYFVVSDKVNLPRGRIRLPYCTGNSLFINYIKKILRNIDFSLIYFRVLSKNLHLLKIILVNKSKV